MPKYVGTSVSAYVWNEKYDEPEGMMLTFPLWPKRTIESEVDALVHINDNGAYALESATKTWIEVDGPEDLEDQRFWFANWRLAWLEAETVKLPASLGAVTGDELLDDLADRAMDFGVLSPALPGER